MDKLIEIKTVEEFEKAKTGKTIFMFTANWCPDCMFVKPFIGDIVDANSEFKFYVVNRDDLLDLCKSLDILGIPSFVAYNDEVEIGRFVSKLRKTKDEIQAFIDSLK